jgi:two-component system alkaline phosphatase synthesis response regulator PhoP
MLMTGRRVLVVEDDAAIRRGIVDALRFAGFAPIERDDGPSGLEAAISADLDLVLLDVMLPGMDGFGVLERLRRARPRLPVIMVTARGAEADCVTGLKAGADDYVVKPFGAKELLARVEAVLRRSAERPSDVGTIDVGGRRVDFERREVTLPSGEQRLLSEKEAATLRYLAGSAGRAVSRDELLESVWGLDPRGLHTRTVDVHIARLREKLDDDPAAPRVVVTVRAKGYMLARDGHPA